MVVTIIGLSVLGAVISAVIGTFWYSQATPMGRVHMQYLGFDKLSPEEQKQKIDEAKPHMPKMYGAQMALSALTSFFVAFMMIKGSANGESLGMIVGYLVLTWLCFMVPIIGSALLWSNCDRAIVWKKFFSDIFCNLVTILVIALVVSWFV